MTDKGFLLIIYDYQLTKSKDNTDFARALLIHNLLSTGEAVFNVQVHTEVFTQGLIFKSHILLPQNVIIKNFILDLQLDVQTLFLSSSRFLTSLNQWRQRQGILVNIR